MDEMDRPPGLEPLASARPLTPNEAELVRYIVGQIGSTELTEQLQVVDVVSECACGCPSIGLTTTGPALSDEAMLRLSDNSRGDSCEIRAWGQNAEGHRVQVNLHLVGGRLHELEVWAGWDGSESVTTLPGAETLSMEQ